MVRQFIFLTVFVQSLVSQAGAFELSAMSATRVEDLNQKFKNATIMDLTDLEGTTAWNCNMYGMRSRLAIQAKKNLYVLENGGALTGVKNQGFHIVHMYSASTREGLVGQNGPFKDVIRKTKDGQLIAELSLPKEGRAETTLSTSDKTRAVVAYSVCNKADNTLF